MRLRPLEQRDLERVRELRNRDRRFFFRDEEISAEQQRRWFAALGGRPVRFYAIELDGEVVGTISATETADGVEIGNLLLDEAHRGRGLMRRAVEELTAEPGRYLARVKPDNEASLRVFAATGFEPAYVALEKRVG